MGASCATAKLSSYTTTNNANQVYQVKTTDAGPGPGPTSTSPISVKAAITAPNTTNTNVINPISPKKEAWVNSANNTNNNPTNNSDTSTATTANSNKSNNNKLLTGTGELSTIPAVIEISGGSAGPINTDAVNNNPIDKSSYIVNEPDLIQGHDRPVISENYSEIEMPTGPPERGITAESTLSNSSNNNNSTELPPGTLLTVNNNTNAGTATATGDPSRARSETPGSLNQSNLGLSTKITSTGDHQLLVAIPFFEELDKKSIKLLRAAFERRQYEAGEIICEQGKASDAFFVIISGSVEISITTDNNTEIVLSTLHSGNYLGHEALIESRITAVNVKSLERSILLSISKEKFSEFVSTIPTMRTSILDTTAASNTRVALHSLPFFSNVPELKLQQLASLLEFKRYNKDEIIVNESDPGDGLYIIIKGTVSVFVELPTSPTTESTSAAIDSSIHKRQLLNTLNPTEWFGELSLLHNVPRTASCSADQDGTILLYLETEKFKLFVNCAPEVFNESFRQITNTRTSKMLKSIHLFDVLCKEQLDETNSQYEYQRQLTKAEQSKQKSKNKLKSRASRKSVDFNNTTTTTNTEISPPITAVANRQYDEHRLALLAELFSFSSISSGSIVFKEGDRANALYVIIKGHVQVSTQVESGKVILAELGPDQYFGEISLIFSSLRTATVTAIDCCTFLVLTSDKFSRFLTIVPELKASMEFAVGPRTAAIIENIPFFRDEIRENKPWSKLGILGSMTSFYKAEQNEFIIEQNKTVDRFYVVVSGQVEIQRSIINSETNNPEIQSTLLGRGTFFADDCLLKDNCISNYTVRASTLSVLLTLSKVNFDKFLTIAPELKQIILHRQNNHYKPAIERQISLAQSPVFNVNTPRSKSTKGGGNNNNQGFHRAYTTINPDHNSVHNNNSSNNAIPSAGTLMLPTHSSAAGLNLTIPTNKLLSSNSVPDSPVNRSNNNDISIPIANNNTSNTAAAPAPIKRSTSATDLTLNPDVKSLHDKLQNEKLQQQLQILSAELEQKSI